MLRGERENGRKGLRKRKSLFNIIKQDEAPPGTDKPNIVETMQVDMILNVDSRAQQWLARSSQYFGFLSKIPLV